MGTLYLSQSTGDLSWTGRGVWAVAFSPDGEYLFVGGEDGKVRVWEVRRSLESQRFIPPYEIQAHQTAIWSLALSPDGKWLVTAGKDGIVRIWPIQDGHLDHPAVESHIHTKGISKVVFSPDGRYLASGSQDGTIIVSEMPGLSEKCCFSLAGTIVWVTSVAFAGDGTLLVSGGADGVIRLWDVQSCTYLASLLPEEKGLIWEVSFSPDSTLLAAGGEQDAIWLWGVSR